MIKTDSFYTDTQTYYQSVEARRQKDTVKQNKTQAAQANSGTQEAGQAKLSKKAQDLLERLKKTYSNMDFMVADFEGSDEAKKILSRGTKEYSVLFTADELEKMASSETYEKENIERLNGALKMSEKISKQFGPDSAFGQNGGEITRIGISFNADGTTSYFAELEKSSTRQREYIEKKMEDKRTEKQEAAKKEQKQNVKRTTVQADSLQELAEKIQDVDWDKIKPEDALDESGSRFDYSC